MQKNKFIKVIVAMSGGVDSSVAAYILFKKGYRVEGMFMKNWEEDDTKYHCSSHKDLQDTRKVCNTIGIKLHEVNFSTEYWNYVFKNFIFEHKQGRTPNPDILCNKKIKFGVFFNFAINFLKADYIATGHYAQIKYFNQQPMLIKGKDKNKDQSYFLYTLTHHKLKKIIFPLGKFKKQKVRILAKKKKLHIFNKPDSMSICFIEPVKIKNFLNRFIINRPGNIVNLNGYIIGKHDGLIHYTIGQRKGIGIGGQKNTNNIAWYVLSKNLYKNSLIVIQGLKNLKLMSIGLIAININWINKINISNILYCTAKTRYRQKEIFCKVILNTLNVVKVIFKKPISCITPGQSIVFYNFQICLGGGIIKQSLPLI